MPGRIGSAAVLIALGLTVSKLTAGPVVTISVAYYDTEHASPTKPTPWLGSPSTIFFGNPDANGVWDTGAILVSNAGPGDAAIDPGLIVDGFANGASFRLWDSHLSGGLVIPAGQSAIFAGPGSGTFDTSDQPIIDNPAQRTNNHPAVHITIDNARYNFTDATQVLNTGGFDPGNAFGRSESEPWTQIGLVPEPELATALGLVPLLLRRRTQAG